MYKIVGLKILIMFGLVFLASCSSSSSEKQTVDEISKEIIELLVNGETEEIYEWFFTEELQESLSKVEFSQMWKERTESAGNYLGYTTINISSRGETFEVMETSLEYQNLVFQLRMIFNNETKLVSLHLSDGVANIQLPDNVIEEEVVVGEGTHYELGGTLTLPQNKDNDNTVPAVVLVHGSGPSDRNSAVFAYQPFRDLAWGLAKHGIAVLRYDKRTYIYGSDMTPTEVAELTVHEETVEDAILAGELLKNDPRIDSNNVYVIGHSLGGMLAPRIDTVGGEFAGLIIMAGSLRPLWEIIYDQNMAILTESEMDETERVEMIQTVEKEYERALQLMFWSDEKVKEEKLFGLPAGYFKEMEHFDTKELVSKLDKPILVLQGEKDFQVYYEKDFSLWKEVLKDHDQAMTISYPELNHFFIQYEGEAQGTLAEYEHPGVVHDAVIQNIAEWVLEQVNN
ncbi:alpha/beta fold hydrolase [Evansella tamaricis]|uniref:Alpha/beta fold hydrolase n=1 Tax=Evansella tamaricis TaxID=2069301 RepID=A0ABS6JED1_9BACI|nr:alpha/beta fold hydrolase [Evansella tamaricis]MBU9711941.1 alpha/beta fold hydrolase [Evansella tamaricis]